MKKAARKKQRSARLIVLTVFLLIALVIFGWIFDHFKPSTKHMDPVSYFGIGEGEAAVIADGVLLEVPGVVRDGVIYVDAESAGEGVSPAAFYDQKEELLIVTGPTDKTVYPLDGGSTADGQVVLLEDRAYMSLPFLSGISDAHVETYTDPDRAVITTKSLKASQTVSQDAPVRYRAGIKSPILTDLAGGTEVETLDVSADGTEDGEKIKGWTHVRTDDGYTGYMQDRYLENPHERTVEIERNRGEYTFIHMDEPVNMVFHQVTNQAANDALQKAIDGIEGINVIAPTWFFLDDTEGGVASLSSADYVETAHAAGLKVWAVLNDFDGGISSADATASAIGSDTNRTAIVDFVMGELAKSGADGLNIDLEKVKESSAPDYLQLVREFSAACRKNGLVLSVDNYVPKFTKYMNRTEQGRVVDYIVTMCYDEHTASSEEAGSVSSLPYVRQGIADTIAEVSADQVIAAIPFYTRFWETKGGEVTSSAYGMEEAERAVAAGGMEKKWDEAFAQYYAESEAGGAHLEIWLEDAESIAAKMNVIREYQCAGVAEWKLGLETSDIWGVINEGLAG